MVPSFHALYPCLAENGSQKIACFSFDSFKGRFTLNNFSFLDFSEYIGCSAIQWVDWPWDPPHKIPSMCHAGWLTLCFGTLCVMFVYVFIFVWIKCCFKVFQSVKYFNLQLTTIAPSVQRTTDTRMCWKHFYGSRPKKSWNHTPLSLSLYGRSGSGSSLDGRCYGG